MSVNFENANVPNKRKTYRNKKTIIKIKIL